MSLRKDCNALGKIQKVKKTFLFQQKKKLQKLIKIDCNKRVITIFKKIKFIDSAVFMGSSLSNLNENLAEGTYKVKCNSCDCFFEC